MPLQDFTLISIFNKHLSSIPNKTIYTFLEDGENESGSRTYKELYDCSKAIALKLLEHCKPGDRVLLMYPSGLEFIDAFFGCLMAGVIAVPAFPPTGKRRLERLENIGLDCKPSLILTSSKVYDKSKNWFENTILSEIEWIQTDLIRISHSTTLQFSRINQSTIAFLQYTSGSTGSPKGVMVDHSNIIHNSKLLQQCLKIDNSSIYVSWLPIYHDMGLIGSVIQSFFAGCSLVFMPPVSFVKKPVRWLKAMSKYKATVSGGPNFAFDLCVRLHKEQIADIDLSSLKVLYNGAEPIRPNTLTNFKNHFESNGLSYKSLFPCYGMAETTLVVSGRNLDLKSDVHSISKEQLNLQEFNILNKDNYDNLIEIVNCGTPLEDMEIKIVDPETKQICKEGVVGELWVKGPSVARGYWNKEDVTKEIFEAYLLNLDDRINKKENPYLRTGDMGFLHNNEVYISGRLKEMMIINGVNHYPQDIERIVQNSHTDLQDNAGAVFSILKEGKEEIVVMQEIKRTRLRYYNFEEVIQSITEAVFSTYEISVFNVILLSPGRVLKTTSGKISRVAHKLAYEQDEIKGVLNNWVRGSFSFEEQKIGLKTDNDAPQVSKDSIEIWFKEKISQLLNIDSSKLGTTTSFAMMGLTSVQGVQLCGELSDFLGIEVSPVLLYDYPSISSLSSYLMDNNNKASIKPTTPNNLRKDHVDIAIISLACKFPGANNTVQFWENLISGKDGITKVPPERWSLEKYYSEIFDGKHMNSQWGGFIEDVDKFDAGFFGISSQEAKEMDPQQRLLLEQTYCLLENSGYAPSDFNNSQTGVYIGISQNSYDDLKKESKIPGNSYSGLGSALSISANRLSYHYNFKGPSMAIDTACSSSLVGLDTAIRHLREGLCEMAIAGGVNLILSPDNSVILSQAGMLSNNGRCKTFDEKANGYVRSEGCGLILLKTLDQAQKDKDQILAVIKGSSINQDGKSNGLSAPSGIAQQEVISKALLDAKVTPDSIAYVETHGTGTSLGDPIEVEALYKIYGADRKESNPLYLGSVKSNIGHLESAAGIAGVIKAVLCLQHRQIPRQLHFKNPNPHINWENINVKIPKSLVSWTKSELSSKRRAGVSSFGFGGTNAHLILEEAPEAENTKTTYDEVLPFLLMPISAITEKALSKQQENLNVYLEKIDKTSLNQLSYHLATKRDHFKQRVAYVVSNKEELRKKIQTGIGSSQNSEQQYEKLVSAFLFTGQGAQYVSMAKQLYDAYPLFKNTLDSCFIMLEQYIEVDLKQLVFATSTLKNDALLSQTQYTQPALFSIGYALFKLWTSWGVRPKYLFGHSIGELTAACAAGVFSLEDGIKLIAYRGKLMQALPNKGTMVSVQSTEIEARELIKEHLKDVDIAAINGPQQIVLSGKSSIISKVCSKLEKQNIGYKKLEVSNAFHSPLMNDMLEEFEEIASEITYYNPNCQIISSVTGELITEELLNPSYWVKQIRATVCFTKGMETLSKMGCNAFIELGPQPVLTTLGQQILQQNTSFLWLSSLKKKASDTSTILHSLAKWYEVGGDVDWENYYQEKKENNLVLPNYPFERQRYWIEDVKIEDKDLKDYLYDFSWVPYKLPDLDESNIVEHWLIIGEASISKRIQKRLKSESQKTAVIHWKDLPTYQDLDLVTNIIVIWFQEQKESSVFVENTQNIAVDGFLKLQELAILHSSNKLPSLNHLWWLTHGVYGHMSSTGLSQSTLWPLARVFMNEHPELPMGMLDINGKIEKLKSLPDLLRSGKGKEQFMLKEEGVFDYKLTRNNLITTSLEEEKTIIKDRTILITGGLGDMGLNLVEWFLKYTSATHFLLTGRNVPSDSAKIKIDRLKQLGGTIQVAKVNVIDRYSLENVIQSIPNTNPLQGVIHLAGVLRDGLLVNLNVQEFKEVLEPKIKGAWNLHELTKHLDLNFFVLFSSISSIFGARGQCNHASANGFLDGLTVYRRKKGLPSHTINWGTWDNIGNLRKMSEKEKKNIETIGLSPLSKEQGFAALKIIIEKGSPSLLCVDIKEETYAKSLVKEWGKIPSFYDHILMNQEGKIDVSLEDKVIGDSLINRLRSLSERERLSFLQEFIQEEVNKFLHLPNVPKDQSLLELGLDSLMAIQLRNILSKKFKKHIPVTLLLKYPTIIGCSQYFLELLDLDNAEVVQIPDKARDLSKTEVIEVDKKPENKEQEPEVFRSDNHLGQKYEWKIDEKVYKQFEKGVQNGSVLLPTSFLVDKIQSVIDVQEQSYYLNNIALKSPIYFLKGTSRIIQIIFLNKEKGRYEFDVKSKDFDNKNWVLHAKGELLSSVFFPNQTALTEDDTEQTFSDYIISQKQRPSLIPLSYAQERFWFLNQLNPRGEYHSHKVFRLEKKPNKKHLKNAIKLLIDRHEVLRTVIKLSDQDLLFQEVLDMNDSILKYKCLEQDEDLGRTLKSIIFSPFNLSEDIPIRIVLVETAVQEFLLAVSVNHIAIDGGSESIILNDLINIYEALVNNQESYLTAQKFQYADYAIWQKSYLTGARLEKMLKYWDNQLNGVSSVTLPYDFINTDKFDKKGKRLRFQFSKELKLQLVELSRNAETTLFMTLLAAFKVLIHKYTGEQDLCIGAVAANRHQKEEEQTVGVFINTLPLRSHLHGNSTFMDVLAEVRNTTLQAYDNQSVPFEKNVSRHASKRGGYDNGIFQILFGLQRALDTSDLYLGDIKLDLYDIQNDVAKFDMTFMVDDQYEDLNIEVEYRSGLYKEETIKLFLSHYENLLTNIVDAPKSVINHLQMLSLTEKNQLLQEFNNKIVFHPEDKKTVVDLFRDQVTKTPNHIAVVYGDKELTYKNLDEKSNQLARYLITQGVHSKDLVGICMDRSLETIIGILGILKSGAAYLPIDSEYPIERINFMLEDAGLKIVLCDKEVLSIVNSDNTIKIIQLDRDWDLITQTSIDELTVMLLPSHLAYVIYTSGSTGSPKGVLIEHKSLSNFIQSQKNYFGINAQDQVVLFSNITFDASVEQIFISLVSGAALHVVNKKDILDSLKFEKFIINRGITHLHAVPLFLRDFMIEEKTHLKRIVSGGDVFDPEVYNFWNERGVAIFNKYGPTEATITSVQQQVNSPEDVGRIGKPIANTHIYIMNKHQSLLPVGAVGELYIGGLNLAKGYLNRIDLTKEKFIDNPFKEGERLYKTGDLARWLPDGNIEFIGRKDHQVKIRGYRIELGEIESVLTNVKGVRQSCVLAKDDAQGAKRLVGYVTPEGKWDKDFLQNELKKRLPDYMVPQLWVAIGEFPLTSSGKLDRQDLPDPEVSNLSITTYVAPRNDIEHQLAEIWQYLLGLDRIGVYDNFFELGGHSLLAMRLISRIRKKLDIEINIQDVFDYDSLEKLSLHLSTKTKGISLPPIVPQEIEGAIPLSFSQERLWFLDQLQGSSEYHMPFAFRLSGVLDPSLLSKCLRTIVSRHEVLRTVIVSDSSGTARQEVLSGNDWELMYKDMSRNTVDLFATIAQYITQPFDLSKDYMLRCCLYNQGNNEYILVGALHHISSDGWSNGILIQELAALYSAHYQQREANLPTLPLQYKDYAVWQRSYLTEDLIETQLSYWEEHLSNLDPLQLPTDRIRSSVRSIRGSVLKYDLDKTLGDAIKIFSDQEKVTLFMTMLSAFKVLLSKYSDQDDICVGTPVANRRQSDVEGMIGFFVNTLALRSKVDAGRSFRDFLNDVKKMTITGLEHQDAPFKKVVDRIVTDRSISMSPLFQVMFVLESNTETSDGLFMEGLTVSDYDLGCMTSKFDLTLQILEKKNGLSLEIEYCADLFDEATISRMAGHYETLLKTMVEEPSKSIRDISLLNVSQRHQLLEDFNQNKATYLGDNTLIDLFSEQAKRAPEDIALIYEGEEMTYGVLDERSNQLAHYLIKKGVKFQDLVGLCMERNLEMIIGMLAILKSGGVYVPIDPKYPKKRIHYMLTNARIGTVLCSSTTLSFIDINEDHLAVISLDQDWSLINQEPKDNGFTELLPDHLAYVIYTSGSTGKPKGVMIEHQSIVNTILSQIDAFSIEQGNHCLQFASLSFDASIWEIFLSLLSGAKLFILPEERKKDIHGISSYIQDCGIEVATLPPLIFQLLEVNKLSGIKVLITAGEEAPFESAKAFAKIGRYINAYGPTETSICATTFEGDIEGTSIVPIGRPISNTKVYILDQDQMLVPIGTKGELCIGGAGLARGYLHRPDLTKEKFIPNPYCKGKRLYRTGDLAKWLPNGNIEFMGRKDDQVKIRGYRIELGEIEHVLSSIATIKQSCVLAKTDSKGTKHLVGYVVLDGLFDFKFVQSELSKQLAIYMVPHLWVVLDEFPLTKNNKLDKNRMPDPNWSNLSSEDYTEPRNEMEEHLVKIWQELLGIEQVGIHDNFFELGGDSIISIQLVTRMRIAGYVVQPKDLFNHPTISKISAILSSSIAVSGEQGILEGMSTLLPIQAMFFEFYSGKTHYNQSVLLTIDKSVSKEVLQHAFSILTSHHDALRFSYKEVLSLWQQYYGTVQDVLEFVDISREAISTISTSITAICEDYQQSFNLEKGSLFKAVLFRTPDEDAHNRLFLVAHHLVIDGVSWRIILDDLSRLLKTAIEGSLLSLGSKGSSYREWVSVLGEYAINNEGQLSYWENISHSYRSLPVDYERSKDVLPITATHKICLEEDLTTNLFQKVHQAYSTEINDILLSCLVLTIGGWSNYQEVVIGLEGHGREDISEGIDLSRSVGWFTNLYPVLLRLPSNSDLGKVIKEVKEQLRNIPDKGIGYGALRYLHPNKLVNSRLAKVKWDLVFNYLGQLDNVIDKDSLFNLSFEDKGKEVDSYTMFENKLMINTAVIDGRLNLDWSYSSSEYDKQTIEALAHEYVSNLRKMITHCMSVKETIHTPSDYGLGKIVKQEELNDYLDNQEDEVFKV